MNLFKRNNQPKTVNNDSNLSELALKAIQDGVIMTDRSGVIKFINPAAVTMTGIGSAHNATGLDYGLVIKLESKEGRELPENENPLIQAMKTGQPLESYQGSLIVGQSDKRIPIAISVLMVNGIGQDRIITFRNISKELEEEGEQTEFISTASHEMRTPVATIDGYLSLALNPRTAAIDERARSYLMAAQAASKHLGKLFQDLLDVTKLDDGRIRPRFQPVEMVSLIENLTKDYVQRAKDAKLNFTFGSDNNFSFGENHRLQQVAYGSVDPDFMREIMDNLVDNAIKYTPEGGSIYVNVRGDGDRVLINVTDTGMGISSEDLAHIFQKFYRADNSDTRTIGGTGLGLYLVKQRVEAMGGKIWAESAFGEGSTFYVSLPRITNEEYEKRMIAIRNQQMQAQLMNQVQPTQPVQPTQLTQPTQSVQPTQPIQPTALPQLQPIQSTQPAIPPQPAQLQPQPQIQPQPQPIQSSISPQMQPIQSSIPPQMQPIQSSIPPQMQPIQPQPAPIRPSQQIPPSPQPVRPPISPQPRPAQPQQVTKQIDINLNGGTK